MCLSMQCMAAGQAPGAAVFAGTMVEMSWPEVKAAAEKKAVVLLPISVVEEHGPHLDLGPDIYLTAFQARTVRDALVAQGTTTVIAPPYYWGINSATGAFPGSFTVAPETFRQMLLEIVANLQRWGFEEVYFLNDHGDREHNVHLDRAAEEIRAKLKVHCHSLNELPPPERYTFRVPFNRLPWRDIHAGANETRWIIDLAPDRVRLDKINGLPRQGSFADPLGYVGDPARYAEANNLDVLKEKAHYNAARILAFRKGLPKLPAAE